MRTCETCGAEFEDRGFLVITNELLNGVGMVIINAVTVDEDFAADKAYCGRACAVTGFSEGLEELRKVNAA